MKKILGLDLGTNSIGWALIENDFENKEGRIIGNGVRIIPMSQDILDKFGSGQSHSQTADRTTYRGIRRLFQRDNLRRERLHRVLNVLGFLPEHYAESIDFNNNYGQFKKGTEPKINYCSKRNESKDKLEYQFIFIEAFNEMIDEFKVEHPELFYVKADGIETKIPYDWTIYYLRKKALVKKLSKNELAWLLLNFNQKRGYYQLRGDEEIEDNKKYEVLKVKDVVDSGDSVKGKTLYNVIFENGWKYDKQITQPEEWVGKNKEFIVTTTVNKDDSIKRTFKKVDATKDWIAIKKKTEQDINASGKTVGCYIYSNLLANPKQKINGSFVKTIERKFYKNELHKILNKQIEFHTELQDQKLYEACINELYHKNETHKRNILNKGFEYLFIDDIIFYQRPLKSQKSNIAKCQYEKRVYKIEDEETGKEKWVKEGVQCISKSNPLFIEFRLWQFLHNLKIYELDGKNQVDITNVCLQNEADWCDLFDFLNNRKEVEQKNIIEYFIKEKRITKEKKEDYCWNYVVDKKYPCNDFRASLITRLKKAGVKNPKNLLSEEFVMRFWHIIYSVTDKAAFENALKTFAYKYNNGEIGDSFSIVLDVDSFVENFKKYPPIKSDYGSYSEKAIKKLLPLMRLGRYWDNDKIDEETNIRIDNIFERINSLNIDTLPEKRKDRKIELERRISIVADDDIKAATIKSFISVSKERQRKGLNTYQACYVVYGRHSEIGDVQKWKTPADIDKYLISFKQHSLRNPIVEQVLTETLRTVRDIWIHYGESKSDFFNEIHLELGRDMKNPADKRKRMTQQNAERENTNERIILLLEELKNENSNENIRPYSPSHQEILKIYEEGIFQNPNVDYSSVSEDEVIKIRKNTSPTKSEIQRYKLWLEQKYLSPYTGQPIPLSGLFSTDYQIEHVIPQSRYFNDSLSNKVICESAVNSKKSNMTAYEFMKDYGTSTINLDNGKNVHLLSFDTYQEHCNIYFKKNRAKLKNLLCEEIPEDFINRQLNDSRYISIVVKGLLSNILRQNGELETTSKNLISIPGSITSKLKKDWGLNDKWNEIIAPRFIRLNEITKTNNFGCWDRQCDRNGMPLGKQFFRCDAPKEAGKLNKKRIDHRHHTLDAMVIASCTREHINYLNSLNSNNENHSLKDLLLLKNKEGDFTKNFKSPWVNFPIDVKTHLETTVVSFKQNLRIINKTNNYTWQWREKDGKLKKQLVKQEGTINWAIRKPLHKETVSGIVSIKQIRKGEVKLTNCLSIPDLIVDGRIRKKVKNLFSLYDSNIDKIKKHLKNDPIEIDGKVIENIQIYEWTKRATATRTELSPKFKRKQLEAVTDSGIKMILENHLKNYIDEDGIERFDLAFSEDGIEKLNKNIKQLNNGKAHQPIYKVRIYEVGSKFSVSDERNTPKNKKFVEAAKGTNLFFAIYWDEEKQKRNYQTVPLNEVIAHQKATATLPKKERTPIAINPSLGRFLFTLSPNDLVYIPSEEELINSDLVDFRNLSGKQSLNIYKMISSSLAQCFFIRYDVATPIINKLEFSPLNKMEKNINNQMIKEFCWKLKVDRLGNIIDIIKG